MELKEPRFCFTIAAESPNSPGKMGSKLTKSLMLTGLLAMAGASDCCFGQAVVTDYSERLKPVFSENCTDCHNPDKKKGGLDLTTLHGLSRGGINGAVVAEGDPQSSALVQVLAPGADPHMPPKSQLPDDQIAVIRNSVSGLRPGTLSAIGEVDLSAHREGADYSLDHGPDGQGDGSSWTPPDDWDIPRVIDYFLDRRLAGEGVGAAPVAGDLQFARRVWLDLTGGLPSAGDLEEFIFEGGTGKRSALVDRLLDDPGYPVHMREIFDGVLMGRRGMTWEDRRRQHKWFDYLENIFEENRPWNVALSEMIVARPESPESLGSEWFLYERKDDYQAMAEAVAPVAFGTQMKCAQCHDHPLAHEIKQAHYWAMVAAFNRSKNVSTKEGIGIAESAVGGFLEFANLRKETQSARLDFFNGVFIPESAPPPGEKPVDDPGNYVIPPVAENEKPELPSLPRFSRRAEFARAVAQEDNFLAARGMVNRLWAHLLGRGLVHPVDEINSFHPPSHPELLDWLSRQFVQSGFDIKWLIRSITGTRAYQRTRPTDPRALRDPSLFAGFMEKPLPAEALWRSFVTATGNDPFLNAEDVPTEISRLRERMIEFFPDLFPVEFNVSLQQAMFLSNSPEVYWLTERRPGNLVDDLLELETLEDRVKAAFRRILLRNPDSGESARSVSFLREREDRQEAATGYLVWALLNTPEFMLNH